MLFFETKNFLLNFLSGLILVNSSLKLNHLILVEQDFHLTLFGPSIDNKLESLDDLILALNNFIMQLRDHLVLHHILEESVWNILFSIFIIDLLLKDFTESIPPSSELSGRLKDVSAELVKLSSELINCRMEYNIRMGVATDHLYQTGLFCSQIDGLYSSQSSDN